jgi:hypothetical protein
MTAPAAAATPLLVGLLVLGHAAIGVSAYYSGLGSVHEARTFVFAGDLES